MMQKLFVLLEKQVESTSHSGMLKEMMEAEELLISLTFMCNASEQQYQFEEAILLSTNGDNVKAANEKELSQWNAEKPYAEK